ncbi:SRPBCC family protein [Rhodococcus artemisiae]|uniref:SRPBCC family protein n=1 Tax=Rhodococcus artemisiae TaxID=714159 RepID=A0ABU7LJW1_9NOCA|nr:SRPBCC family protein [Rhodococcus artemisiae]MEE2061537.1 SRPBCC family protein [Rhodococcus artemisiae]
MARTSACIDLPAPADQVWDLIGGFDSLPDWLPFIPFSNLSEGARVRTLTTEDGGTVIERLEAFDNAQRSYSYSIIEAPFPVTGYRSTLAVHPNTDGTSRVEWSGEFTPVDVSDDEVVTLFNGIYTDGLVALAHTIDARHRTGQAAGS